MHDQSCTSCKSVLSPYSDVGVNVSGAAITAINGAAVTPTAAAAAAPSALTQAPAAPVLPNWAYPFAPLTDPSVPQVSLFLFFKLEVKGVTSIVAF